MKFTKKYLKDREASYQRSKKGELDMIAPKNKLDLSGFIIRLHEYRTGNYDKVVECKHRTLSCGCDLPLSKRHIMVDGYVLCECCNAGNPNL